MPLLVYSFSFGMSRGKIRSAAEVCADCFSPDPGWASVNRGVLICDECCSVHRSLGRHVSQIKSLRKGSWVPTQLAMVHALAASGANHIWEHSLLLDNKLQRRKPVAKDPVHPTKADFIRAKYQNLAFTRRLNTTDADKVLDISRQLHSCVRTDNLETTLRLLSLGADPNYLHPEKGTAPLHVAAKAGQILQIEVLVVYGSDPGGSDVNGDSVVDYARNAGHKDIADRLIELQYELTDRIAFYLCGRKPDHRNGHHFIIPEMADNASDLSELAKAAKRKLTSLANKLFEELAMDVYDEVDRRELDEIWYSGTVNRKTWVTDRSVPFLPVNPQLSAVRNQGRQKLARFNAREFATLIIDILNDARRRQMGVSPGGRLTLTARDEIHSHLLLEGKDIGGGSCTRVPVTFATAVKAGKGGTRRHSTGSDDEPVYDSVASDEDSLDSTSLPRKSVVVLSSKEGTPANHLDADKTLENFYEEADPGSEDESSSLEMKSDGHQAKNAKKVMINGDGKAPPPTESEYEKIEIFSNSVPIDAYLKLKQMLVESDNRIQELLAANQDLKQEVSLLQNMVQTLMEENVNLRRGGGTSTSTSGVVTDDSSSLGSLAATFAHASSSPGWSPETQLRMAQFHRALLRENGLATSTSAIDFYAPPPSNATTSAADLDDQSKLRQQHQLQQQQRSHDQRENLLRNNNNNNNNNARSLSANNPLYSNGKWPLAPQLDIDNHFDNNRNHLVQLDDKNGVLRQRLSRTSNDLDRVANTAFRLQPQQHPQQQPSRMSGAGTTRDDSSIHTVSTRVTSRSFAVGDDGGGGRGHRNRPVSMFEPRLTLSRGGGPGGVDPSSQPSGGGVGGAEALHHNQTAVNDANVLNASSPPRPGWINSYSARGEGPAGNVHQDHTASCFQLPTTPEQAEGIHGPKRQTTPVSDPRSRVTNNNGNNARFHKNGHVVGLMGHLMEEETGSELGVASNGTTFPEADGPGGTGGGKMAKVMVDTFLPREEDVIRKTEKITKKIQDLLVAAQEGRSTDYAPAADKICYAVTDMRSLFPENPSRETIRSALALLQASAYRLQAECHEKAMPGNEYPPLEIPHVIQRAYDIAKAAKALVTEFQ